VQKLQGHLDVSKIIRERDHHQGHLQHYQIEFLNSVIDWQLREFNDRFNEVNLELLIHMASFSPKNSFAAFNYESLLKLAGLYPDDFGSSKLINFDHELAFNFDHEGKL
jgi:hypothetical protein